VGTGALFALVIAASLALAARDGDSRYRWKLTPPS
jgi:hypothetical protein